MNPGGTLGPTGSPIVDARVIPVRLALRAPLVTATGALSHRDVVVVRLQDAEGRAGWGEAARWPGAPLADLADRLRGAATATLGRDPGLVPDRPATDPAVRAAIDTASLDLVGRSRGASVAGLLGGAVARREIEVNALIGGDTVDEVAAAADSAVEAGFGTLKLKVGRPAPVDDVAAVRAVRAVAGDHVALRLDANAAWSPEDAAWVLERVAAARIEYVEDPVADPADLAHLAPRTGVALAVDQPLTGPDDAVLLRRLEGVVSVAVVKPTLVGGPVAAMSLIRLATDLGMAVVVTSAIESAIGRAMAAQVTAAAPARLLACGLATGALLAADLADAPGVERGRLALCSDRPGLGIEVRC